MGSTDGLEYIGGYMRLWCVRAPARALARVHTAQQHSETCERTHALLIIVAWATNIDNRVTTDEGLVVISGQCKWLH